MFSLRTAAAILSFASISLFSFADSAAIPRDVWSPRVLTPNVEEGWVIGTRANVTWDTSDAPANISNAAIVALGRDERIFTSGPGSIDDPLASGFDLRVGFVEVTVPDVEPGDNYQVLLFGDSGNWGPVFTIFEAE